MLIAICIVIKPGEDIHITCLMSVGVKEVPHCRCQGKQVKKIPKSLMTQSKAHMVLIGAQILYVTLYEFWQCEALPVF